MLQKMLRLTALLDRYGALLTSRQREMCENYYLDDYSLGEIAEIYGVSRQAVHDTLMRAERAMEEYETVLALIRKSEQLSGDLGDIISQLASATSALRSGDAEKAVQELDHARNKLEQLKADL